jgi:nucleotide-binding universal stress UspA family protein
MAAVATKPVLSPETSPKFKSILFTTDFSPSSELALPYARAVAERFGSTIHILHVVDSLPVIGPEGESYSEVDEKNAIAQQGMKRLTLNSVLNDVPYTTAIKVGLLWEVVAKAIADLRIDLIVLGTHGRGGLKHLVLGSVAEEIFRRADCPVLTVGPNVQHGFQKLRNALGGGFLNREGKLDTIVYATDLSVVSRHALPYALSLARANRSKLVLVHAAHSIVSSEGFLIVRAEELAESARIELAGLVPEDRDFLREIITRSGPPADVILEVAAEACADLIVMGAHRGTSSHAPWATAHQVVRHAECPVLTVRS